MNLLLNRVALHILEKNLGVPVISENLMNFDDGIREYLEKHILKCFNDPDLKKVELEMESDIVKQISKYKAEGKFLEFSQIIANRFYELILEYSALSSCDLILIEFQYNSGSYIAALKMNYKKGYIHFTKNENGIENYLVEQLCSLPLATQKIDEYFILEIDSLYTFIKEKKINLNGEYEYYISKYILSCKEEMDNKEKVKIISDTANRLITEHYDDDIILKGKVNRIIKENIEDSSKINVDEISESVFKDESIKHIYREEVSKKGIRDDEVNINNNYARKIKDKQKIITPEGIELSVPFSILNDKEKIDFIVNENGTISILLKNIDNLINK